MDAASSCPGCPECKPAASGPDVTIPESSSGNSLTKDEFVRLMCDAYVRYVKLPDPDKELFDAASYLAGLEHGYREAYTQGRSPEEVAQFVARCLFSGLALLVLGLVVGLALR